VDFGIYCSISTDDPEMFDTDLSRDYELATSFGISPRTFFEAGVRGALSDGVTKDALDAMGKAYPWPEPTGFMDGSDVQRRE
jgi:aminodeoxyfutalosine deaminase